MCLSPEAWGHWERVKKHWAELHGEARERHMERARKALREHYDHCRKYADISELHAAREGMPHKVTALCEKCTPPTNRYISCTHCTICGNFRPDIDDYILENWDPWR